MFTTELCTSLPGMAYYSKYTRGCQTLIKTRTFQTQTVNDDWCKKVNKGCQVNFPTVSVHSQTVHYSATCSIGIQTQTAGSVEEPSQCTPPLQDMYIPLESEVSDPAYKFSISEKKEITIAHKAFGISKMWCKRYAESFDSISQTVVYFCISRYVRRTHPKSIVSQEDLQKVIINIVYEQKSDIVDVILDRYCKNSCVEIDTCECDILKLVESFQAFPKTTVNAVLSAILLIDCKPDLNGSKAMHDLCDTLDSAGSAMNNITLSGKGNIIKELTLGVANETLPLQTATYDILYDTVKFFNLDNTSAMRYSQNTKLVSYVAYKCFGGNFLRFFNGFKNAGQNSLSGYFSPQDAQVIIPLPSETVLRSFNHYEAQVPSLIKPVFISSALDSYIQGCGEQTFVLKFDGRRLRPGLEGSFGDVDYGGFEIDIPLADLKDTFQKNLTTIEEVRNGLDTLAKQRTSFLTIDRIGLIEDLGAILNLIWAQSIKAQDLKAESSKKLKNYHRLAGEDWVKSKYKKIIPYLTFLIRSLTELHKRCLDIVDRLCEHIALFHESVYFKSGHQVGVLSEFGNHWSLEGDIFEVERVSGHHAVKQRSETWFNLRKEFILTGSILYQAAGLDTSTKRKALFDNVHYNIPMPEVSSSVASAMEHGCMYEESAIATICTKIIPVFFPKMQFVEVGSFPLKQLTCNHSCSKNFEVPCTTGEQKVAALISPDGLLIDEISTVRGVDFCKPKIVVEIKCPYFLQEPHTQIPVRYIPQLMAEMAATGTRQALYVSYTKKSTTVFLLNQNEEVLALLLTELLTNFIDGKRNIKVSDTSKILKVRLGEVAKSAVFCGEFLSAVCDSSIPSEVSTSLSATASSKSLYRANDVSKTACNTGGLQNQVQILQSVLCEIEVLYTDVDTHLRKRASESVTFMLSRSDRETTDNQGHGIQVGYVLAGSSCNAAQSRKVRDEIYLRCVDQGAKVVACAFDGKYHSLINHDADGSPLTVFALVKELWASVSKLTKAQVITCIVSFVSNCKTYTYEKKWDFTAELSIFFECSNTN